MHGRCRSGAESLKFRGVVDCALADMSCPGVLVLRGSQELYGGEESTVKGEFVMIPVVGASCSQADKDFSVREQCVMKGVKEESACGVESELVALRVPYPLVRPTERKYCRGKKGGKCDVHRRGDEVRRDAEGVSPRLLGGFIRREGRVRVQPSSVEAHEQAGTSR